jgi:cardiolipin synthase
MRAMDYALAKLLGFLGTLRAELLAPIDIAIAVIVTMHVLLTKRDIGAATAWIGLGWLSPIFGGILYAMFGVNRVRRRARRLVDRRLGGARRSRAESRDWDGHLAPLERAGSRLTGRPMLAGNSLTILENGDEAFPVMLAAIDAAERTVALSSYIFRNDAAGRRFVDACTRAVARGIEVRVLLDGIGSGYIASGASRAMRRGRVPTARFMHSFLPWRMPFLNLRTHKKILVIDGQRAFTGGMNIGAENLLETNPRHPVRDTHFDLTGPVVAQLSDAFARDWTFTTGEELDPALWRIDIDGAGPQTGEAHARVVTSGPDSDIEKIEFMLLQAIACAQRRIRILTPYFLPEDRLITALSLAASRGIQVDVVIPERSNQRLVDWGTRTNAAPLLEAGVRIWRNRPPFEHSKLMVVDGLWSMVGSANWDMRSLRLNFEVNVEIYDTALADRIESMIAARMVSRLDRSELDRRTLPTRLGEAATRLLLPYL